ncbi:MAG: acyltransferase domain-containing protein, partial [Candidatus Eremiobacterota bacterium]
MFPLRTSASGLSEELKENLIKKVTDLYLSQSPEITEDTLPGELPNVIAGRVANVFNLTGKSMAVDAACAASLAALDTAVKGLMVKDYDTALVGAVEGVMDPASYTKFCKIGALSATGSRPFDTKADGFVMAEGCGFIVIKRLEDAIKEGDKIYSVLSATGSSTDGKGKGITAPNPKGQKQAIMMAIEKSGTELSEIQHIEAHGTSTKIGDIAELQVLADIFTDVKEKFAVTSVKSQIGHLKSAAGMAGLIKSALSLYNRILPPSINFEEPNSKIDWEKAPFYINRDIKEWKRVNNSTRKCGVSAFGFGGTNYHAILEEYDPESFIYKSFCEEKNSEEKYVTGSQKREEKKLTFMFSGQGSQYVGMIKELYESSDEVKNTVEEAERICLSFGKFSVKEKLFGKDGMTKEEAEKALRETKYTQPCLYTVEMALYRFLKEKGIVPHMVSGHSSGEYSALAASGVLSFEDGLKAMISRGSFMSETQKIFKGTMAAVRACGTIVEEVISSIEDEYVTVANYNSPEETVISGTVDGIEKAVAIFKEKGFSALKLNVSTAFHSELMDRAVSKMNEFLDSITFRNPQIPVYSNVTGLKYPDNPDEIRNILKNQIKSPVRWMNIIKNIYNNGGRVFVEIGPKKALFNFVSFILKDSADIVSFYIIHPKEREYERLEKLCPEIIKAMGEKQEKRECVKSAFRILEDDDEIRDLMNKPYFEDYLKEHRDLIKLFFLH